MTEAEWLTCTNPQPMLDYVRRTESDRKLRLFGVGTCRQLRVHGDAIVHALETAEQYADTGKTKAALKRARQGVKAIRHSIPNDDKTRHTEWVALWLAEVAASENAFAGVGDELVRLTALGLIAPDAQASLPELMRCVFGNPFGPVSCDRFRATPAVVDRAQRIYDERDFERIPELADALENARCADSGVSEHCRRPGPHVRGCWVVDLVLGKA